jgi:hypothetical protein
MEGKAESFLYRSRGCPSYLSLYVPSQERSLAGKAGSGAGLEG